MFCLYLKNMVTVICSNLRNDLSVPINMRFKLKLPGSLLKSTLKVKQLSFLTFDELTFSTNEYLLFVNVCVSYSHKHLREDIPWCLHIVGSCYTVSF